MTPEEIERQVDLEVRAEIRKKAKELALKDLEALTTSKREYSQTERDLVLERLTNVHVYNITMYMNEGP